MLLRPEKVEYPDSDGEPVAENDVIRQLMISTESALRQYFRGRPDVYISSNLFLFFVEGEPKRRVAPDLFVVFGVEGRKRRNYKIWEEGKAPDVVFEFTTASSRIADMGERLGLYAALGIPEYYVYDPTGEYLEPRFRAFRLVGDVYQETGGGEGVFSPLLGLQLRAEGQGLSFYRPDGRIVADAEGLAQEAQDWRERAEREAERAAREAERAACLEDEVRRLRAELDDRAP